MREALAGYNMWRPPKARSGPNLLLRSPLFGVLISHRKMLVSSLVSEDYPVSCVIIRKAIVVSRITGKRMCSGWDGFACSCSSLAGGCAK